AGDFGMLEVDRLDLDQGELALALLRLAHLAGDGVAGAQVEAPDLARGDVDVVRTGEVVVLRRTQEAEAVREALEHPLGEDEAALLGLRLEHLEDQLLLAHPRRAFDAQVLADLGQLGDVHLLERADVQGLDGGSLLGLGRLYFRHVVPLRFVHRALASRAGAIAPHSSLIPSPVRADTAITGVPSSSPNVLRISRRAAGQRPRDCLSILVAAIRISAPIPVRYSYALTSSGVAPTMPSTSCTTRARGSASLRYPSTRPAHSRRSSLPAL